MITQAGVDERAEKVRAYLAEKQEGRAIPTAIIAALDSLAAELVTLKDALETSKTIEMSAYVMLLEVEALGLSLNGQEALHDELEARGATFPDPPAREALGRPHG